MTVAAKMLRVRRLALWLAVVGGILVVAVVALLLPSVQRVLLLRGLASAGATDVELGYFHVTPFGLQAGKLKFRRGPLQVDARGLVVAANPWSLWHRRLEITKVSADAIDAAWDLDFASRAEGSASAAPSPGSNRVTAPFPGVLRMLRPASLVSIGSVSAAGRLTLFRGARPFVESQWQVQGGGLEPGGIGKLDCSIDLSGPALAASGGVGFRGALSATEDASGQLLRLKLDGTSAVKGGQFAAWPARIDGEIVADADGEAYTGQESFGANLKAAMTGRFSRNQQTLTLQAEIAADVPPGPRFASLRPVAVSGGALGGSLAVEFRTDGPSWSLTRAAAVLKGGPTGARVRLELAQPWSLAGQPESPLPTASLRIEHFPINLTSPRLAAAGLQISPAELAGAWNIKATGDTISFLPLAPVTIAPLRIGGPRAPLTGAFRLQANPEIEVTATKARVVIDDLRLTSEVGYCLDTAADATFAWSDGVTVEVDALEMSARRAAAAPPFLAIKLLQPLRLDGANPEAVLGQGTPGDLLRMTIHDMPLAWLSRWLPGRTIAGNLTEGGAVVSRVAGPGLTLATTTPWRFAGLRLVEGGREYFSGSLQVSPAFAYGPAASWVRFEHLAAADDRGYRLSGSFGVRIRGGDGRLGGGVSLDAEIPRLPGAGPTLGPLHLALSANAHAYPGGKGDLSRLAFTVATARGRTVLSISADQPISVERTKDSEWLASSALPIRFATAGLSLARLNPYLAAEHIAIGGAIPPNEFRLWLSPRHLRVESTGPAAVKGFHLERQGEVLIDRALLRCGVAVDLQLEHRLLPVFQMKSAAVFRVTDGVIAAEGAKIARFDGRLGVSATERGGSVNDVAGSLWLDLGAMGRMPLLADARLPATGELTFSLKKSQDKVKVVEFDGQITDLVGRDGATAPSLTVTGRARGDVDQRVGGFTLQATLLSSPRPSDLHFGMRFDFGQLSILDLSSKLEGTYVDVDALRKFSAAFAPRLPSPPRSVPSIALAPAPRPAAGPNPPAASRRPGAAQGMLARAGTAYLPAGGPPWGGLRGHFTLAVKTVVLRPYTIEDLGGRLDITPDSVTLSGLSAKLLGGKWSADFATRFHPGSPDGAVSFDSHFRLVQLDAGQAVRMRYPNPASGMEGRFDLDVTLAGRANRWEDLASSASGRFALTGHEGRVRMTLPKGETISNSLLIGGMLTFSSELRAVGRLVRKLSEVPITQLKASGTLNAAGQLHLDEMILESPEMRLVATGRIADAKSRDLVGQPLSVQATLAASGDLAVILAGMHLVDPPGADGYRLMNQPFIVGGNVGQPDFHLFYDVLARAVEGSHGSWGLVMRKVQAEAAKLRTSAH